MITDIPIDIMKILIYYDDIIPICYQSTPPPAPPLKGEGSSDDVSPFPFREGGRGVR